MPTDHDIIVLGCGTMGAATCLELARAGKRVLGLDRHAPPHDQGEHHGQVRMFRMSYYEHPAYVPWLKRSLAAWQDLGRAVGQNLLELTGALYLGRPDSELISGSLRSALEHGLAHELLDHSEVRRRFPMFRIPAGFVGLLERDAGFVWCSNAVEAMLAEARRLGAEIRTDDAAKRWSSGPGGVEVQTATLSRAKGLVITAGPWSAQLLADTNVSLTVTRQVQGWLTPGDPAPFMPQRFPCWAIDIGGGALFYGFPALPRKGGQREVKVARHSRGTVVDPSSDCRAAMPEDAEDFLPLVREYLPSLADTPVRACTCLYTNSPDSHFIIDRHPRHANVAFGCGFSGHGFKMAPAVGQLLKEIVLSPTPHHPEPFFALSRLGSGGSGSSGGGG